MPNYNRPFFFRQPNHHSMAAMCIVASMLAGMAQADQPSRSPEQWLGWFAEQWDEGDWVAGRRGPGYMRKLDDHGWQARMRTLRGLVTAGSDSIAALLTAVHDGEPPVRILAAQSLGYLAPHVPRDPLNGAAASDPDPAVRLYAIDSLGMQGRVDLTSRLKKLQGTERNGDAKKHIGYALERKRNGVDEKIVQSLLAWDPNTMNSARVGQLAPDFELTTVSGKQVRLSNFRGKKRVALIFIYGDT